MAERVEKVANGFNNREVMRRSLRASGHGLLESGDKDGIGKNPGADFSGRF